MARSPSQPNTNFPRQPTNPSQHLKKENAMRIVGVVETTKPISPPIRNAYIDFSKMTSSLVAVVTDVVRDGRRVIGYGFNSNGRYGQGGLIRERFRDRILEAPPESLIDESGDNLHPHKIWAAMMSNEKPGGHGERSVAVGTLDMAIWDATAKIAGYPLFWYEEAGDPLEYALQAALAEFYPGPMATGENLFSHQDARNLLRYGGMRPDRDWLQFDCALSYGLVEYLRTLDVLAQCGWLPSRCIPHGGHQMSLNIAAGLGLGGNESYPGVFSRSVDLLMGYRSRTATSSCRRFRVSVSRRREICSWL